jgi:hypothetical protein
MEMKVDGLKVLSAIDHPCSFILFLHHFLVLFSSIIWISTFPASEDRINASCTQSTFNISLLTLFTLDLMSTVRAPLQCSKHRLSLQAPHIQDRSWGSLLRLIRC